MLDMPRLLSPGLLGPRLFPRSLDMRLLYSRLFDSCSLVVTLALRGALRSLLTLNHFAQLLLLQLTLLARLHVTILALRERGFALLTVCLALLSFTHLTIAIDTHAIRERLAIEDRRLRGRCRLAHRPFGARWAILSFADHDLVGNAARRSFARLATHGAGGSLILLRRTRVRRRAACKTRGRGGRFAPHYDLAIDDRLRRPAEVCV